MTSWSEETSEHNIFVDDNDSEPVPTAEGQSVSETYSESTTSEYSEDSSEETEEDESEKEVFVPVVIESILSLSDSKDEEVDKIEEMILEEDQKLEIFVNLAKSAAQTLVRDSMQEALDFLDNNIFCGDEKFIFNKISCEETPKPLDRKETLVFNEMIAKEIRDLGFDWPSNETFTEAAGVEILEKYLETWTRDPIWRHAIQILPKRKQPMERIYNYAVVWFRATRRMPIPKVTAAVHFKIVASNVPLDRVLPVLVSYSYEGQRVSHSADSPCQLSTVVLSKIMENKLSELRKWLQFVESSELHERSS